MTAAVLNIEDIKAGPVSQSMHSTYTTAPLWTESTIETTPQKRAAVGWIGLGKLGLPCALALNVAGGLDVHCFDITLEPYNYVSLEKPYPIKEDGIGQLLAHNTLKMHSHLGKVIDNTDIVFVAVPTPHAPEYGGETLVPKEPADFDYTHLIQCVKNIVEAAGTKDLTLVIISTVLPGTMNRDIKPLLPDNIKLVYNPFLIAMSTTIKDFLNPEFIIIGADNDTDAEPLINLYHRLHGHIRPIMAMSIPSAELTKIAYNTFVSQKIVFANTVMEICHKTEADCDDVTDALSLGTDRIVSAAYMQGGMGDGGACHPRDNIAMSWLAKKIHLSYDLMGEVSKARDRQMMYLAGVVADYAFRMDLPIVILGKAYKPETNLTAGSPAMLLGNILRENFGRWDRGIVQWDPIVDGDSLDELPIPAVYVVATKHKIFTGMDFSLDSYVIDPFGYMPERGGQLIRIGRKAKA